MSLRRWPGVLLALALTAAPRADALDVLEFFNPRNGHYVLISDPQETALVESGIFGPWVRTGYAFAAPDPVGRPRVCRFHSARSDSHFITADAAECAFLRSHTAGEWRFEHIDFAVTLPLEGRCPPELQPIYRLYNNRWRESDSNHRFTWDASVRDTHVARGWIDEGVRFCAASLPRPAEKRFRLDAQQVRPTAECENESLNLGGCVALNQIPRVENRIPMFSSAASHTFVQITGSDGDLHTAQDPADAAAVARHAFVQTNPYGPWQFGLHVTSIDRTVGELASINPLYQFVTSAPAAGAEERRVFPWPAGRDRHLDIAFTLEVRKAQRLSPTGHAYGHPTLQFRDVKSGQDVYVTMGTYGTVAPVDFVAMDESTQRVIVATTFRAKPAFGKRIEGDFIACDGSGPCDRTAPQNYRFRLDRADFATVLAKARALHPHLSAEPADYLLVNFHFNNEIYRDAAIGARLMYYVLELFPAY